MIALVRHTVWTLLQVVHEGQATQSIAHTTHVCIFFCCTCPISEMDETRLPTVAGLEGGARYQGTPQSLDSIDVEVNAIKGDGVNGFC